MSVEITFEDEGQSGLVAEGTFLWEAAKRLGVRLPADCNGRGECDTCTVAIVHGAELLSPATDAERRILGSEYLARAQRLACQTKFLQSGEVIVRPVVARAEKKDKYRRRLRDLPLNQQVSSLIELQAITVSEAVNAFRDKYIALIGRFLNLESQKKNSTQPKEHVPGDNNNKAVDNGAPKA